jgi:hypothetical protein
MLPVLRLFIRTLLFVLIGLIALRFFVLFLQRAPGIFVALSVISAAALSIALYKGSFSAVGLHTKKSIKLALAVSALLFIVSTAILIFVK